MEKVRMGVIGLGGMGQAHMNKIREIPEAELTAVSDVDSQITKRISQEYKVVGFTNYEKLLESELVDAVLIATPHYFHPEIGIKAMKKGVHCLSEKLSRKNKKLLYSDGRNCSEVFLDKGGKDRI